MTLKQTKTLRITNINQYGDHDAAVDLVTGIEEFLKTPEKQGTLELSIHCSPGDRPWESDSYSLELTWEV